MATTAPGSSTRRWWRIGIAVAVVAALALAGSWIYLRRATTSTPVSVDDALTRYRESSSLVPATTGQQASEAPGATTEIPTTRPTAGSPTTLVATTLVASTLAPSTLAPATTTTIPALPATGVYRYATQGGDKVDALGGAHHDYPATTTITVVRSGCGVDQRWDVLEERWVIWHRCPSAAGWLDASRTNLDTFFGQSQQDQFDCQGDPRPVGAPAGTTWTFTCTGAMREVHALSLVGLEDIDVGGTAVSTEHVRDVIDDGNAADHQVIDTWYVPGSALVVRQQADVATTRSTLVGDVHYHEGYTITLLSLSPAT